MVTIVAVAGPLQSKSVANVIDAATQGDPILTGITLLFITVTVTLVGNVVSDFVRHRLQDVIEYELQRDLMRLATTPSGIAHHEHPDAADRLGAVRDDFRRLSGTVGTIGGGLMVVVGTAATLVMLGGIHPLLLVLPLIGLLRMWASAVGARESRHAIKDTMVHARRYKRLMEVAREPRHGLEIRAAGARRFFADHVTRISRLQNEPRWKASRYGALLEIGSRLTFGLGYGGAIAFVVFLVLAGRASVGDVVLVALLAGQTDQAAQRLAQSVASLVAMLDVVGHLRWLRVNLRESHTPTVVQPATVPTALEGGIQLHGVSFTYPGSAEPTVSNLSISLPAGSTIALVGGNGAGKSTLVKLLAGLYVPSSGTIKVDQTDLGSIEPSAWRARVSIGFQDFVRYEYLASEAIALGEPSRLHDLNSAETTDRLSVAINAGDARNVIDMLPEGIHTRLGSQFGGSDLSGGQWQRIALSRAFFREQPVLTILDEPGSALDPASEHDLLERYKSASLDARNSGGITLLVSHRLSTVRLADLILVLANGQIVESGTHDGLMAKRGRYAGLYSTQSAAYSNQT
ncbi:ABC transporter ATP-binding protein [Promicromonospora sp. MS192]|uniref:ABC transporter ATP-binding protein n=1 Tax=Promicromonospora sp. MS192 TaxID=3412684 RepID=UPI003C2B93F0